MTKFQSPHHRNAALITSSLALEISDKFSLG